MEGLCRRKEVRGRDDGLPGRAARRGRRRPQLVLERLRRGEPPEDVRPLHHRDRGRPRGRLRELGDGGRPRLGGARVHAAARHQPGHDQIRWHRRPHLLDGRAAACQPNERHGDGPARRLRHLGPRRYLCNHPGEARRAGDCSQGCGRGVAAGSDGLGRPPDPGASGSSWCSVHVPGSVAEPEDALPIAGEAAAHARGGRSSRGVGRMHHQRPADGECRIVSTSQVRSVWCAEGARRLAA
mmetsp:Transcript_50173/g.162571  ORF Transcript_50173/g.162571 Transcript_50173/m.162571 type:complete len:240 (-) Transcript_50173:106-825(-)